MRAAKVRCYDIANQAGNSSKHLIPRQHSRDFPETLTHDDLRDLIDTETRLTDRQAAKERNW